MNLSYVVYADYDYNGNYWWRPVAVAASYAAAERRLKLCEEHCLAVERSGYNNNEGVPYPIVKPDPKIDPELLDVEAQWTCYKISHTVPFIEEEEEIP